MRNKARKIIKFTFGLLCFCLFFFTFLTQSVSAVKKVTIKPSQLKTVGTYSLSPSTQGATVTEDYYIYTKWTCNSCKTYLIGCKRNKPSNCKTLASGYWGHASTVYNKWGTDTVNIVSTGGSPSWCINFKTGKAVKKCDKISPSGLSRDKNTGTLQGYTKYGNYYLRGWGYLKWHPGQACELRLYKKNSKGGKSLDTVFYLPKSGDKQVYEIEGVGVDGNGNVYISAKSNGKLKFFKISASVLQLGNAGATSSQSGNRHSSIVDDEDEPTVRPNTTPTRPDAIVSTIFFGDIKDDGKGCGIYTVLDLVMTIMTIGIGVLAVISISLAGITYATAGGNVAKTTKAKRRIYETIIGLVAYAAIFAILTFLLPEFNPELKTCGQIDTSETTDETETDTQPVDTSVPAEDDTVDIDLTNDAPTNEE